MEGAAEFADEVFEEVARGGQARTVSIWMICVLVLMTSALKPPIKPRTVMVGSPRRGMLGQKGNHVTAPDDEDQFVIGLGDAEFLEDALRVVVGGVDAAIGGPDDGLRLDGAVNGGLQEGWCPWRGLESLRRSTRLR